MSRDRRQTPGTYDLLDNLAGGVEVDETLVDLELVAVPGLGALTARRLAGRDRKALGREAHRALDAELLVLRAVDEVRRDYRCPVVSTGVYCVKMEREESVHFSRFLTLLLVSVIRILWILAAGTGAPVASFSFSPLAT